MTLYDVMQVCLNGHKVNGRARTDLQRNKKFCTRCGAKTITACPECDAAIRGDSISQRGTPLRPTSVPNNCHNCGTAFPWRQAQIAAAIEALEMGLTGQDATEAAGLVREIAVETPRTQVAAMKLKWLLPKIGGAAYEVAVKVISDVASETAKKTLGF